MTDSIFCSNNQVFVPKFFSSSRKWALFGQVSLCKRQLMKLCFAIIMVVLLVKVTGSKLAKGVYLGSLFCTFRNCYLFQTQLFPWVYNFLHKQKRLQRQFLSSRNSFISILQNLNIISYPFLMHQQVWKWVILH